MKKLISVLMLLFAIGLGNPVKYEICTEVMKNMDRVILNHQFNRFYILRYYWDYSEHTIC